MWKFIVDNFYSYLNAMDHQLYYEKLLKIIEIYQSKRGSITKEEIIDLIAMEKELVEEFASILKNYPFLGSYTLWQLIIPGAIGGVFVLFIYDSFTSIKKNSNTELQEIVSFPLETSSIDFLSFKSDLILSFLDVVSCQEILLSIA